MAARNPPWSTDEHILALDFYFKHYISIPGKKSDEVVALSRLLNTLQFAIGSTKSETFRNPDGVYMKLMNFRSIDPDHPGKGLAHGAKGEQEVWDEFSDNKELLNQIATSIAENIAIADNNPAIAISNDITEITEAPEGKVLTRIHNYRERDSKLANKKKDTVLKQHGHLSCEACDFDFVKMYGQHGEGFIECHHTKPVSELAPGEKTKLTDLALLCSNCHRMIHKKRPWLSIEQLKALIEQHGK